MGKNLFIMHTQYNLIISIGLIKTKFKQDINNLILYSEFDLTDQFKKKLEEEFDEIYYIRDNFAPLKHLVAFELGLKRELKKVMPVISEKYDKAVISQERPFENIILHKIKSPTLKCIAIEEDAYYSAVINHRNKLYRKIKDMVQKLLRLVILKQWDATKRVCCYGSGDMIDEIYVNFPDCIRDELINKQVSSITKEMLKQGIIGLYGNCSQNKNQLQTVVIVSDLIERYSNKEVVIKAFETIAEYCETYNIAIHIKYHPRENKKLVFKQALVEIDSKIAMEKILLGYLPEKTLIIGNMSNAIFTAKKLGYNSISVAGLNGERVEIQNILKKMGIYIPINYNELICYLENFVRDKNE